MTVLDGLQLYRPCYPQVPRLDARFQGPLYYQAIRSRVHSIYQQFPFDVIHAHFLLFDGYAAVRIGQELGIPVIITVHGTELTMTMPSDTGVKAIFRQSMRAAHRVTFVSSKLARLALSEDLVDADRVAIIPNGIDESAIAAAQANPVPRNSSLRLLSVCNLVPLKNIDLVLEALAQLGPEFTGEYHVVGDGPQRLHLVSLAARLGLAHRVFFHGKKPHAESLAEMAACDVFVVPSAPEGFGIVFAEAMAMAKPVIGCAAEGPADFVRNGENGMLVSARSLPELTSALRQLIANSDLRDRLGAEGRRSVMSRLTWGACAEKYLNLYNSTLERTAEIVSG